MHEGEYEAMFGLENSYWWYVARRILAEELLSSETNGRKSVRILDVGCGTGANMCAFERQGTTTGVDTSIEALTFCRTRGLQRLVLSAVEKLPFERMCECGTTPTRAFAPASVESGRVPHPLTRER